jgi:hypothetical protein
LPKKVTPLPIDPYRTIRRKIGSRFVPCEIGPRYLVFPEASSRINAKTDFMFVALMTMNDQNQSRKLCQLVLNRHALLAALANCPTEE